MKIERRTKTSKELKHLRATTLHSYRVRESALLWQSLQSINDEQSASKLKLVIIIKQF